MTNSSHTLPQVQLGRDGPMVGAQGLGCMGISEFYGCTDETEAWATLERALDLGVSMLDTADMYGLGKNEAFLSAFLRERGRRAFIATKFGYVRTPQAPDDWSLSNRPDYIGEAVDRSLRRLGVETIDLYYMHRRDRTVPLADSIGAMADLVRAGKVRWLGLSEVQPAELREAHAIHPIAALQSEWSLFSRDIEAEVAPLAAELGVAIVPFAPLGRGLLTGRTFAGSLPPGDARLNFPRFAADNLDDNQRLVVEVETVAAELGATPAQTALAWLYQRARALDVTLVPIPGARRRTHLDENVAAATLALPEQQLRTLDTLAAKVGGVRI